MAGQVKYEALGAFDPDALTGQIGPLPGGRSSVVTTTPLPSQGWLRDHESVLIGVASIAFFLALWQAVAAARFYSPLFLPGPSDIALAFVGYVQGGEIAIDVATSGQEFLTGYIMAAVLGIPLGILIGWYPRVRSALDPFVTFFYVTPRIALVPLLIIWFGIGIESKVAVVFLGAFFAIVINTTAGVRSLDQSLLRVARSFGANDRTIFTTIALPGSVPFILTGLRIAIGHALIGVFVGELVAAQHGVGQMMSIAGSTFQSALVFVGLIIFATAGLIFTYVLQRIERHFDSWRPQQV